MLHLQAQEKASPSVVVRAMRKRQKTRSSGRDPEIQIRKVISATEHGRVGFRKDWRDCHTRTPDIGIGIEVFIPHKAGGDVVYYGEYLGHGQSKTTFELHCPGEFFHGNVLKVSQAANDMEPHVFLQASARGLTTPILFPKQRRHDWGGVLTWPV